VTTALFILAVVAAASVCPALMWWNACRGRRGCLPGRRTETRGADELESLRRRQAELTDRIGELAQKTPTSTR